MSNLDYSVLPPRPVDLDEVRELKEQAIVDGDLERATKLRDIERQMMISKREEEESRLQARGPEVLGEDEQDDQRESQKEYAGDEDVCGDPFCGCAPPEVREAFEAQRRQDEELGEDIAELAANIDKLLAESDRLDQIERENEENIDRILEDIGTVATAITSFTLARDGSLVITTRVKDKREVVTELHARDLGPTQEKLLLATYATFAPLLEEAVAIDIQETLDNAARLAEAVGDEWLS